MKYLSAINLNQNEIQNARIQNLASAPSTPVEGQIYHNTGTHRSYVWNGSAWVDITSSASGNITSISVTSPITSTGGSSPNIGHDNTDGNMHVPATSTTNNKKVLKAGATAGSLSWANVDWTELTSVPSTFAPPIATSTVLGGVKQGTNITIDASGVISATAAPYTLPTASATVLGGIKVGTNLTIDGTGVLSANSNPSSLVIKEDQFTSTANQTVFNLTSGYTVATGAVEVFVNGSKQPKTSYTETNSNTITLTSGLSAGADVIIRYINIVNVAQGASTVSPSNTATSGTNYGSNNFTFQRSTWNGTTSVTGSSVLNIDNTGKLQWVNESSVATASINQTGDISGRTFTSTVTNGTAPFNATSTTLNTNFNADLLDGLHADGVVGQRIQINNPASDQYYLVGTLPVSTGSTFDKLIVEFQGGTGWSSTDLVNDWVIFGNRDSGASTGVFNYQYMQEGSGNRTNLRMVAYKQADGSIQVYLRGLASQYAIAIVSAYGASINSQINTAIPIGSATTTVPSGTVVFDSGTATPNAVTNGGSTTVNGTLTVTGTSTHTGAVSLNGGGTSTTVTSTDNSTSIATTAFVKNQAYATLASPALTGAPTAPTATVNTNTTQIATTAFVVGQVGTASPVMDGTATVGTSLLYARQDHIHPTDTSRAPLASPALTGTPTAPTATVSTNTTQVATTAFVLGQVGTATPNMDGTASVGTSLLYARQDHIHPTDTSRAPLASPTFTGTPSAPTPTASDNSTTIATTSYVTNAVSSMSSGLYMKASVRASTTGANITLSGTQTIDGVALVAGDRVLVKDQTTTSQNGIYVVSATAWSLATDANTATNIKYGMWTIVDMGTVNQGTSWVLVGDPDTTITVGTTAMTFSQYGGKITAGTGITVTGTQVGITSNYVYTQTNLQTSGQASVHWGNLTNKPTTVSTMGLTDAVTTGGGQTIGGALTVSGLFNMNGGGTIASAQTLTNSGTISGGTYAGTITVSGAMTHTGSTTFGGAVTINSGQTLTNNGTITNAGTISGGTINASTVPWSGVSSNPFKGKYVASIGDGTSTSIAVTHSLGTTDVHVQIFEVSTGNAIMTDYVMTSTTVVTFNFATAPTASQYRVVILA